MILLANPDVDVSFPGAPPLAFTERVGAWNGFEVASAELLSQRELLTRVDRKFVASTKRVSSFLRGLRDDYRILLAGDAGWARYETCYFDTPDLRAFSEHLRGRRPRFKVRIRHHMDRGQSFLEVKCKTNACKTQKARRRRQFGDSLLSDEDRAFIAEHCALPAAALDAAVWTNFRRATFVGVETNERITVDVGLTFQRGADAGDTVEFGIIELKQPRMLHSTPAALLLRELGLREQSLSKYCVGVAKVHEGAKPRARQTVSRTLQRIKP